MAFPPFNVTRPTTVDPSAKVTVPVGLAVPETTVAFNVMLWPTTSELVRDAVSVTWLDEVTASDALDVVTEPPGLENTARKASALLICALVAVPVNVGDVAPTTS